MRKNQRVLQKIADALARHRAGATDKTPVAGVTDPLERLNNVRPIVDALYAGEKTWRLREIAERHGIGYWTVYRALKGRPGWFPVTRRQILVSDALYRSWLQSWALQIPLAS